MANEQQQHGVINFTANEINELLEKIQKADVLEDNDVFKAGILQEAEVMDDVLEGKIQELIEMLEAKAAQEDFNELFEIVDEIKVDDKIAAAKLEMEGKIAAAKAEIEAKINEAIVALDIDAKLAAIEARLVALEAHHQEQGN